MSDQPEFVNPGVDFEKDDLKSNWLTTAGLAILAVTVVVMIVIAVLVGGLQQQTELEAEAVQVPFLDVRPTPPMPRLQPNPIDETTAEEDVASYLEKQQRILNRYRWVDKEGGVAQIPIDAAIEIVGKQGLEYAKNQGQ
ncbi:MAG: hypothetical protein D6768_17455 [Chloroflexi bacterium]|nr:MAG: hypothetical protein D6768_17455 [Chloroflexota bacterium]